MFLCVKQCHCECTLWTNAICLSKSKDKIFMARDWTQIICLAVSHSNHYTRMFSVLVWGCNWIFFVLGWLWLIRLILLHENYTKMSSLAMMWRLLIYRIVTVQFGRTTKDVLLVNFSQLVFLGPRKSRISPGPNVHQTEGDEGRARGTDTGND